MCFLVENTSLPLSISENVLGQGTASCISLRPPGKCLKSLSIREIWPTWQMGRNGTSAWPEVENEVGCHHAEQEWGKTEAHRKDAVQVAKTCARQGHESTRDPSQEQEVLSRYKVSCRTLAVGRKIVTKKCPFLTAQGICSFPGPKLPHLEL